MQPEYPVEPEPDEDDEPSAVPGSGYDLPPPVPARAEPEPQPEPEPEPPNLFEPDTEPLRRPRPARNGVGIGGRIAGHLGGVEPRRRPSNERAFRIIEIRFTPDGDLRAEIRRELTTKIYRGGTAMRFTQHEAKLMEPDEAVLLLVRPTGGFAGVWLSGSGRRASSKMAGRCKRLVREMLPELFSKRRRTSRRPRGNKKLRRRTSRGRRGARRARRTSRRRGGGRRR